MFEALTSDRPYQQGRTADDAFALLQRGVGTEFDSDCVAALLRARANGKVYTQHEFARENR